MLWYVNEIFRLEPTSTTVGYSKNGPHDTKTPSGAVLNQIYMTVNRIDMERLLIPIFIMMHGIVWFKYVEYILKDFASVNVSEVLESFVMRLAFCTCSYTLELGVCIDVP